MKRNITFFAVNASYSHTSPALRYLSGMVDSSKWNIDLHEITVKDNRQNAMRDVAALKPDIIAATFYLFNRNFTESFLKEYKAAHPECFVVCGGPEFLGDNSDFIKSAPFIDIAFRGEGELSFPVFLDVFDNPEKWSAIRGVCFSKNGVYVDTGFPEIIQNLDELPFPYARFPAGPTRPFVHFETSRGCSNGCVFCVSANTGPTRTLSKQKVAEHLGLLAEAGIKSVRVIDRTFNEKPARAAALLKMFREDFPAIRFHLEIDPARLAPSVLNEILMAEPGQLHVEAGVQSFKKKTTAMINRASSPNATKRGLAALCSMKNIEVHADLIAGLPYCTFHDLIEDLEIMVKTGPDEIQLEILKALPGTPLQKDPENFGISAMRDPPYAALETRWMTHQEIMEAGKLSVLIDRFYNTECLRAIVAEATLKIPDFWKILLRSFATRAICLEKSRTLEQRFETLTGIFGSAHNELKWALQYAWMKRGLSPHAALVNAKVFSSGFDRSLKLIEGEPDLPAARAYSICAGKKYIFVYGRNMKKRTATAVYEGKKGPG